MFKYLLGLILMISVTSSHAYMITGERLLNLAVAFRDEATGNHSIENQINGSSYMGYVNGIVDSFDGKLFCIPVSVTASTLAFDTLNYYEKNLGMINKQGSEIVILALRGKYPCH